MLSQKELTHTTINSFRAPELLGKIALILVTLYWTYQLFFPTDFQQLPWIFLDNANLIFHEAGHFIFMFFGRFLHILGGSLMQLIVPTVILFNFLRSQQYFSAGFATFWLGESLINLSYYIGDAQKQSLPLLGGDNVTHDWNYLLTSLNLLKADYFLSGIAYFLGVIILFAGLAIMIGNIYLIFKSRNQ